MRGTRIGGRLAGFLYAAALSGAVLCAGAMAQTTVAGKSPADARSELWRFASSKQSTDLAGFLKGIEAQGGDADLHDSVVRLESHIAARETQRAERLAVVRKDLDKSLAEEPTDLSLAKALRQAIELHVLTPEADKKGVLAEAGIVGLVAKADKAAHDAEARGDSLTSGELFVLLDALMDVSGKYKPDVRRIGQRQEMLRLYVPERMWELRNDRQKRVNEQALKDDPKAKVVNLPPYNAFGDDWHEKLALIDQTTVERAIAFARRHVEQRPASELLAGGLEALETMSSTKDLALAFPGLDDAQARAKWAEFLEREATGMRERQGAVDAVQVGNLLDQIRRMDEQTVKIPVTAVFHEFGNGVMSRLDEFSEIIWPDEVRRFQKNTQARFVGVGIQIEYDELQNIRVVTPIEGTPAQRAGVHAGDLITKVDGRSVFGLSLDQAVDVITGPEGTSVKLTLERKTEPAKDAAPDATPTTQEIDVVLTRAVIKVATVKGWKREGIKEDSWDWFIDPDRKIGYVRLTQFADTTGMELDRAIRQMKKTGLNGMVLDLRFNPGGLLDQAVWVCRRLINVEDGLVVMVKEADGQISSPEYTDPSRASLGGVPLVVLINEGSASASEIVSGAISVYGARNQIDAVVLGSRSYGKGSVQNVWPMTASSMIKVTTGYYMLPDKRIVHRRPGAETWGVEPSLRVEMLPKQTSDAIALRRDADIVALDENGAAAAPGKTEVKPDPEDLIRKGTDLQLETALLLLKSRVPGSVAQATPTETR